MADDDYAVAELERAIEKAERASADYFSPGPVTAETWRELMRRLLEVGEGAAERLEKESHKMAAAIFTAHGGTAAVPQALFANVQRVTEAGAVLGALWERERAATGAGPPGATRGLADASAAGSAAEDALSALRMLVRLKDGPRDAAYRSAKDSAWERAREIVRGPGETRRAAADELVYALDPVERGQLAELVPDGPYRRLIESAETIELRGVDPAAADARRRDVEDD